MVFIGKGHEIVVMNAINLGGFYRLDNKVTGSSLKETGDGKKELLIQGDPFRDLLFIFIIIDTGNAFLNEINVVGDTLLPKQKMVFGNGPVFPRVYKCISAFGRKG